MRAFFPTRALAVLLAIGLLDLIVTAILHARGQIEELNPLMAPLLATGEWSFVAVKAATLAVGWFLLVRSARTDLRPVRRACIGGSVVYLVLLTAAVSA